MRVAVFLFPKNGANVWLSRKNALPLRIETTAHHRLAMQEINKINQCSEQPREKTNFTSLVDSIYQTHEYLSVQAVKSVNVCLTLRNFLFGYHIVEYEQNGSDRAAYGDKLLENIAKELKSKGLKNVSRFELSRCRQFYCTYPQIVGTVSQQSLNLPEPIVGTLSQQLQTAEYVSVEPEKLVRSIPFSHLAELIKIDDLHKRLFYDSE